MTVRHADIPRLIVSITVAVVAMCGECWLALSLKVCRYEVPAYIIAESLRAVNFASFASVEYVNE